METNLQKLKNDELIFRTKNLVYEERRIQVELLLNLKEIERRKLFLELGYSSLFDFVTKELKYSESAAYRRIQAMRLLKSVPEIEQKISEGSFSLTAAAQVQTFIKAEEKQTGLGQKATAQQLVASLENKSSREIEKHLLRLKPAEIIANEKVRQVTEAHTEIKLVIPEDLKQTLDQLRLLLSHVNPEMSYQQLLSYLANKALGQLTPKNKDANKNENSSRNKIEISGENKIKNTRYIPKKIKDEVWKRDQGCCSFVSADMKNRCGSKFQLQIDHIQPFALGGNNQINNLRLLCAQHNRWRAEKTFGVRK